MPAKKKSPAKKKKRTVGGREPSARKFVGVSVEDRARAAGLTLTEWDRRKKINGEMMDLARKYVKDKATGVSTAGKKSSVMADSWKHARSMIRAKYSEAELKKLGINYK